MRHGTVTSFRPYGPDRAKVMSFLNEYIPAEHAAPPGCSYFRLTHVWEHGMRVIMEAEYDNWADIQLDCGPTCDDYFVIHEAPEEGDDGYAEYREMSDLFSKYYSSHTDEIYLTNMNRALVEGQRPNWVGPQTPTPGGGESDD
jgi:hypothetical protein